MNDVCGSPVERSPGEPDVEDKLDWLVWCMRRYKTLDREWCVQRWITTAMQGQASEDLTKPQICVKVRGN